MTNLRHQEFVNELRYASRSEAWQLLQRTTHNPPRFLYKYLLPKSPSVNSLILDSQLWLASPAKFNDPFEMAVRITFEGRPLEKVEVLRSMSKVVDASWKQRRLMAQKAFSSDPTAAMNQSHRNQVELFGVACLTAAGPRNTLMWSHYADSHKGVCVSFHLPSSPAELVHAFPVDYSDEYPVINWVKRDKVEFGLGRVLWRKSSVWSYEQEHRVVERLRANTLYQLRPQGVSSVVLGARASSELEDQVADLVRQRETLGKPRIKVFRAKLSETEYKVHVFRARDIEDRCYGKI